MVTNHLRRDQFFRRSISETGKPSRRSQHEFDLKEALAMLTTLAEAMHLEHQRKGMHLDICLDNIRINDEWEVEFGHEFDAPLAYRSPEQSGRMNRQVDYRSDYYSLGVVFYELLTARLPFEADSAMELMHAHIARQPDSLNRHNPAVPETVSDIVIKLLSKNAEDRYQSMSGLIVDLGHCAISLSGEGEVQAFVLGQQDISDRLQIPQRLYGRDSEVRQLLDSFDRIIGGGVEMLLVRGYSGIGKSALVHEIHRPVVTRRGYFISGKYDQFKRNVPYSAIIHALRELIRQILTESEARIAHWCDKLTKALGPNAQLIIEVVPELEFILGKQPPLPQMSGARNSFNYVMQNFFEVFIKTEHPLVLFLDDLQWADSASLKLIDLMMRGLSDPCLLVVGAYRDNEVDIGHPLLLTLESIRSATRVSTIEMKALPVASVIEMIADTVHDTKQSVTPLATLIHKKTLGNPFFVGQFLKSLFNEGQLTFRDGKWNWDVNRISMLSITDNVVDLLMQEMRRLPYATQRLLTLAACIGNRFDVRTLATVSETSESEVEFDIQQAIQSGLIRVSEIAPASAQPLHNLQYFSHDRVQQAAYEGIPERERKSVHLRIGRLLMSSMSEEEREERIFDIVHQLNEGRELLSEANDREMLADLNLFAAKKARKSAAFDMHAQCIGIAREFGGSPVWKDKPVFMHELYMELINAAFARADYLEMERLCQVVCDNSDGPREAIAAKDMLIRCYAAVYRPNDLLKTGIESLALANVHVPRNLGKRHVWLARMRLALAMRGRDPLELANMPVASDTNYLLQLQASNLFLGYGFTYLADSPVVLWVALEMIRKSVRYGMSPFCSYAFAVWGRTLAGKLGKPLEGYKFGKASTLLGAERFILGAIGIFHGIIRHRREHLRLCLQPLLDTYVKAMEGGDRASAMVSLSFSDTVRFQSGGKLTEALVQMRRDIIVYRKMDYQALIAVMIPWGMLIARLVGESFEDVTGGRSEEDYLATRRAADDPWGVFYIRTVQCLGAYYFGEYAQTISFADEAMALPGFQFGTPASGFTMFAKALAHLGQHSFGDSTAATSLSKVAQLQREFKLWAENAPMNYLHKWQLVEAEYFRVTGKSELALQSYEAAIQGAHANWYWNDEALANELAAKFYIELGKDLHARMHLEEAYSKYREWGAHAKMQQLEDSYPSLLARVSERTQFTGEREAEGKEHMLDIDTIIKASQTLSGEIQLDALLAKLMRLLIANAGAQRGVLLQLQDDDLVIQAEADAETINLQQIVLSEESAQLSVAIVNFVKRTRERLVIGDAVNDSQFSSDIYVQRVKPKSVLCVPLIKQSQLIGLLYLENNITVDAFTPNHTELLEILSTQIAISLENAALYTDLERKIEARTHDLSDKNEELNSTLTSLRQTQKQLVESEKLASLGQLVAGVAHEINTPVGVAVTGASTLAEETNTIERLYQSGEMKRSDLEHYVKQASTISRLLLSNMERAATLTQSFKEVAIDQTSQERRSFRVHEYIDEVLLNLSPILRKTEHEVTVDCADGIEADTYPGALSQVITNLVMNALLHAFDDGGRGNVRISVQAIDNGWLEMNVSDDGKGIPAEHLPKIFDPFFTTKRGQGGSGLGLNIVHNLVTGSLQGRISVHSEVNVGTRFEIAFPQKHVVTDIAVAE